MVKHLAFVFVIENTKHIRHTLPRPDGPSLEKEGGREGGRGSFHLRLSLFPGQFCLHAVFSELLTYASHLPTCFIQLFYKNNRHRHHDSNSPQGQPHLGRATIDIECINTRQIAKERTNGRKSGQYQRLSPPSSSSSSSSRTIYSGMSSH